MERKCKLLVFFGFIGIYHEVSGTCSATNRRGQATLTVAEEPAYLSSPGWKTSYYSNMDCRWTLEAPIGRFVIVDVMESYFEGSPGCAYDYLGIYDGNSLSSSVTRLCNNQRFGRLFVATGNNVILRLKSDFSVNYAGFSLRYFYASDTANSDCATPTTLTASSALQYIVSPGFPNQYDTEQTCEWHITSSSSKSISVKVLQSDMLSGEVCYSDKLQIFDGSNVSGDKLAEICDNSDYFVDTLEYTTNLTTNAFIKFQSLESGRSRRGFLIAYNETDTVITVPTTTPSSTYSTCGEQTITITDTSIPVFITSPDYPIFYSNNLNCNWQVTGPQGSVLQIKILDFFLEDSEECFGDSVTIYDGLNSGYPQLFQDCGETATTDVNSTGNSAHVSFRADGSTTTRGFKFQVVVLDGGTPVCVEGNPTELNATFDRQYLNSPNYPDNYGSSSTTQWLIYNTESYDYEIVIDTVDSRIEASVGCSADKVQLFKGPCTSYPSLGSFCGEDKPTYTQSSGLYVLIMFTTDSTVNYKGFNISYYLQKTQSEGFSKLQILGIILGVVFGCIALGIISFLLYKFVIAKKLKRVGSLTSLRSRRSSSSSSSSSSSDDERPVSKKFKKLRPLTANVGRVVLMPKKPQLPPIKTSKI